MAGINRLNTQTVHQTLTSHDRAIYFNFLNDETPSVVVEHERIFKDGNGEFHHKDYLGMVTKEFEAGGSFALYNPLTDQPLDKTITHEYIQVILYSLYRSLVVIDAQTGQ